MRTRFHDESSPALLFDAWKPKSSAEFGLALLVVMVIAFLYECCRSWSMYLRYGLNVKPRHAILCSKERMLSGRVLRLISASLVLMVEVVFANLVMLLAATYQFAILLTLVCGSGVGYFVTSPLLVSKVHRLLSKQRELDKNCSGQDGDLLLTPVSGDS